MFKEQLEHKELRGLRVLLVPRVFKELLVLKVLKVL